jgi:hypothetical protein
MLYVLWEIVFEFMETTPPVSWFGHYDFSVGVGHFSRGDIHPFPRAEQVAEYLLCDFG